jgi:hypothetical protein
MPALGAGIHVLRAVQQARRVVDREDGKAAGVMNLLAFTDILTAYDILRVLHLSPRRCDPRRADIP